MKKALSLFLMFIMIASLGLGLTSCGGGENNNGGDDASSGIHYSVNVGTKIEALSKEKQSKIDNYATDCKTFVINGYKDFAENRAQKELQPYIAITDTFVYDFSSIDKNAADKDLLKEVSAIFREDKVLPLMYIEFSGYLSYYTIGGYNYKNISLAESNLMNGFLIFEDETVILGNYKRILKMYGYNMPQSTLCINCGDKYSEELDANALELYDKALVHLKKYE
jgi:hypothetical protein